MSGSVDHASEQLAQRIDDLLPQTQCRKCGYAGCKPYAQAIAAGEADINRCPPGGSRGIRRLAELLGREVVPLDTEVGAETLPVRAYIDEAQCIGCTLCLQACPVDAIVGAAKQMHTVIAAFCTGCELCLPPCPVDCITLLPAPRRQDEAAERAFAQASRQRYEERNARLERERQEKASRLAEKLAARAAQAPAAAPAEDRKRALVATAIARARARRRAPDDDGTDGRGDAG